MGNLLRGQGAVGPRIQCVHSATQPLDTHGLTAWLADRSEVLLVSMGSMWWFDPVDHETMYMTWDGQNVTLPDNALVVSLNPSWLLPEDVLPRPRDDRFVDVIEPPSGWDARTWWYDTGNFGSVGLVVRTIAKEWGIDVADLVKRMEPLTIQADRDLRPVLQTSNGTGMRVTAIRMRRV